MRLSLRVLCCAVASLILVGCGTTSDVSNPRTRLSVDGVVMSDDGQSEQSLPIEKALRSDPVASQMHEISGAMLQYFAVKGRLPPKLEDLQSMADVGRPLIFESVKTGAPFTYVPSGLHSPDDNRQIVLHDEKPAAKTNYRWVILMQLPKSRQGAATWVVPLSEPVFRSYVLPAPKQ